MSKRTLGLILLLFLVTAGLLYLALQPTQQQKTQTAQEPTPTPSASTTFSFSPNPLIISSPSGSVDIMVDTNSNKLTASQFEIQYDPTLITTVDITPGTFFANPVVLYKNIDVKNGKISFAFGIQPTGDEKQGEGTLATITFKSLMNTTGQDTTFTFLPKTQASQQGILTSVLKNAEDVTITYIQAPPATNKPIITTP